MNPEFPKVFETLRGVLKKHAADFIVSEKEGTRFEISAPVGPATLQAWRGKRRSEVIPVAWVEVGRSYVSFHHMALYGSSTLRSGVSKELGKRMQGLTCFNFQKISQIPIKELEELTERGNLGMRSAGFIK